LRISVVLLNVKPTSGVSSNGSSIQIVRERQVEEPGFEHVDGGLADGRNRFPVLIRTRIEDELRRFVHLRHQERHEADAALVLGVGDEGVADGWREHQRLLLHVVEDFRKMQFHAVPTSFAAT
jgi:hypothetical protein